jgi:hypothetical protein
MWEYGALNALSGPGGALCGGHGGALCGSAQAVLFVASSAMRLAAVSILQCRLHKHEHVRLLHLDNAIQGTTTIGIHPGLGAPAWRPPPPISGMQPAQQWPQSRSVRNTAL